MQPQAQRPENRYWCHDCRREIEALLVPDPICPECHGSFVEEITPDAVDDPREFGGQGGGGDDFDANGLLAQLAGAGAAPGAPPVLFRFAGPDGRAGVAVRLGDVGGRGGQQQDAPQAQPINPISALMQAFGLIAPAPANGGRRADDAAAGGGGERRAQEGQGQVPIQNLASFLGEAFGAPHPADHPDNNPFAEGGVEPDPDPEERRAAPHAGAATPQNFLLSLLQSFGVGDAGGIVMGGAGGAGNIGDFAWGEQGFQQILNDLMEQASGRAGPQPATDEIINELPHLKVTKEILDLETIKDCPICREDYEVDDDLLSLPCRHAYHPDCIKEWLHTSGTCPVCRFALVPQPGDKSAEDAAASPGPSATSGPMSPSTSRIPDVQGSRLPGSFPFPPSGRGDSEDPEDLPIEDVD
ncbi:hypothetical protein RQP46_003162 [Phenoliferia psychrophenolica]